nr:diuretic hormone receptor-like [Halyomorpha halys]
MEDQELTSNFSYHIEREECLQRWSYHYQEGWCPAVFDGALCWGPTGPAVLASQPCREEIHGVLYDTSKNATKYCHESGIWDNRTDYDQCQERADILATLTADDIEMTTVIYALGYALSLIALSVALFIFIYFKEMRCLRNTIHTNLMLTYVLADFMWILSLTVSMHTDSVSCLILFTLLHYFILTNFFWMFVEGLYLYMLVVETFTRENIGLRAYLAIGWGLPVAVIIVWVIARFNASDMPEVPPGTKQCTWMNQSWSDWIYQVPAILVLAINLLFLVRIMWVLITKLRSANNAETEQYRKGSKALLVLIPLLGITYILFIAGPQSAVYSNIRALLLSTQGLSVGLLYCFLNTEVQNTLRHRWLRWKEERSLATRAYTKDMSPNTRTESIRLYSRHEITPYRKRESTGSESTTMTLVHSSRLSNGPRSSFLQPPSEPV